MGRSSLSYSILPFCPSSAETEQELEQAIADFVAYYNTQRYHESLDNVTPADVFFGRDQEVLSKRAIIKQQTLQERLQHHLQMTVQAF